jgi:flagellar basal body-associated protein FliL
VRIITERQNADENPKPGKRALRFVGIYVASVLVFAAVSGILSLLVTH